jgi:hypothetical protein
MKRMRKAGVTDPATGELVPFPYMPRVAELPPGWRHFSTADKIEHLIGLKRAAVILSWGPIEELVAVAHLDQRADRRDTDLQSAQRLVLQCELGGRQRRLRHMRLPSLIR